MQQLDLSELKIHEEDILENFVEVLNAENFEEVFLAEDFEADDIWLQASIDKKLVYEIGIIDDQVYVSVNNYNLQYYLDDSEINIVELFEEIVEDYKNAQS